VLDQFLGTPNRYSVLIEILYLQVIHGNQDQGIHVNDVNYWQLLNGQRFYLLVLLDAQFDQRGEIDYLEFSQSSAANVQLHKTWAVLYPEIL
jgi:hypothetical protein